MIMIHRLLRSEQPVNQGGFSTRNEYMLKPKAFKNFGNLDKIMLFIKKLNENENNVIYQKTKKMLNIILNTNYLSIN